MPLTWTLPPPMPPPPVPRWELIGEPVLPVQADQPGPRLQPLSAEQVDVVVNSTPLQRNDFRPLLRLSPSVPTAMTLPEEQWRLHFGTISPFDSGEAGGTGNQNYAVPRGIDPASFGSVVVWCKAFGVLFSAAPLAPASS